MLLLPSERDLDGSGLTVRDVTESIYGRSAVYDGALPQRWASEMENRGIVVYGRFVWLYPEGSIFGQPAPLSQEAATDLAKVAAYL